MKDIHNHILYGIDDGSRSFEESVELLGKLEKDGVTDIILTPHYIENTKYIASITKKKNLIKELQKETSINLYIGNEVYVSKNILELLQKGKISTLNNSRYLLIELPMNNKLNGIDKIVYDLVRNGYIPIIAHPERYSYVQNDTTYLNMLLELGALLQGNYESLFGKYGKSACKCLKKLLKLGYISFLGSDMHRTGYKYHTKDVYRKLRRYVKNKADINNLIDGNIQKVIDDCDL